MKFHSYFIYYYKQHTALSEQTKLNKKKDTNNNQNNNKKNKNNNNNDKSNENTNKNSTLSKTNEKSTTPSYIPSAGNPYYLTTISRDEHSEIPSMSIIELAIFLCFPSFCYDPNDELSFSHVSLAYQPLIISNNYIILSVCYGTDFIISRWIF